MMRANHVAFWNGVRVEGTPEKSAERKDLELAIRIVAVSHAIGPDS